MRLVIHLPLDLGEDAYHEFAREVDRDYARVPVTGERVTIGEGSGLVWPVAQVDWPNDNYPQLTLEPIDPDILDEAELLRLGYYRTEVDPDHDPGA